MKTKLVITLGVLWRLLSASAPGAPALFTVDPGRSQIALSGSLTYNTVFGSVSAPITAQGLGSLVTSFAGTVDALVDASTIQFPGGSALGAHINGVWQPAVGGTSGSAPADYGGMARASIPFVGTVTVYAALRNVVLDVTSTVAPVSNGSFASSNLVFIFPTNAPGTIDYNDGIGDQGSQPLGGNTTNTAAAASSLTVTAGVQTLAIPIQTTYVVGSGNFAGTSLTFSGQLVAARILPPLINSLLVTNQMALLTVTNATAQAQLLISSNLTTWSAASATVSNAAGLTFFKTPVAGPVAFFRVLN
jgi:hypothetical protein